MQYRLVYRPKAIRDLESLDSVIRKRVLLKLKDMQSDLAGDVKRLTDFDPDFRLRVGDYRVLFAVDGDTITVYRVSHRRDVYDR
jgi:mRNA interferase RelE/StbE